MPNNLAAAESEGRLRSEALGIFLGVPEAWPSDHQGQLWDIEAPGVIREVELRKFHLVESLRFHRSQP